MRKIGIYGGSFDPVHFGHIGLALEMREKLGLEEVWFIPNQLNPLKPIKPTSGELRVKMLELALEDLPFFKIKTTEIERVGPSYSVDTLREIRAAHGDVELYFIVGDDVLGEIHRWKEPHEFLGLAQIVVGDRQEKILNSIQDPEIVKAIQKGMIPTRTLEISSTEVRDRVRKGLYIRHLVPAKVVDFIYQNRLYL